MRAGLDAKWALMLAYDSGDCLDILRRLGEDHAPGVLCSVGRVVRLEASIITSCIWHENLALQPLMTSERRALDGMLA